MPSGIDGALKQLGGAPGPEQFKVSYNGFDGMKKEKPKPTEPTIDPEEIGVEKCTMIIKEQEFKIKKLKEKLVGLPPTKKNKPDINAAKDALELLTLDGNYKVALNYVRKLEENERDKRREAQDKATEEEALAAGGLALKAKKGNEPAVGIPKKKGSEEKKPAAEASGPFECDVEVIAVVRSATEGSEEALDILKAGAGGGTYKSDTKAEVPSMIVAGIESITAKLKRTTTRDYALRTIRALLWNPPAVLPALPAVLGLFDEGKLKTEPNGTPVDLVEALSRCGPGGKGTPELVVPVLLSHLGAAAAGKWKIKVGVMGILKNVIARMGESDATPKQLGLLMPKVMMAVRDAVGDARKEVKKEAEVLLRHIGQEVTGTPEIRAMADGIINSILDSANMEKAAEALRAMSSTTFMNTVDSCAFGLIFPIVSRAMREQAHDSKMKGVQIVGASVNLIADPELLIPYCEELMPLLQECLMHPTENIQHEAAKTFGHLSSGLPTLCDEEIMPFLLAKLQSADVNVDVSEVERRGAGRGLAEVVLARRDLLPHLLYKTILPRIASGKTDETKAGGLVFFQYIAELGTQAFLPHLPKCLQTILDALQVESEVVTKQASAALRVIIEEYAGTYPHLLLPRIQAALFVDSESAKDFVMQLFFYLGEKLGEAVKFGQDFLTVEAIPVRQRHLLLSSIFIARTDKMHEVRRMAALMWKERLQSGPKAKGEILPILLQVLKALKTSGRKTMEQSADGAIAELVQAGDVTEADFAKVEPLVGSHGVLFAKDGDLAVADHIPGTEGDDFQPPPPSRSTVLKQRLAEHLGDVGLPPPLVEYVHTVLASCCVEAHSRATAEAALEVELRPMAEKKALNERGDSALDALKLRPLLDKVFDGIADEVDKSQASALLDPDLLVFVEGLRMMYGGGNLLLKDTTLELRRGRRYGVVGRNGAGKTTLMNTIAIGGVAQISKSVKTLHVRPEALVSSSDMNAVQFCKKDVGSEVTDEALEEALLKVGFPADMQHKNVSELSGGWRMKLLLASAMMQNCDILLLDEPTNHLDKESVAWLAHYLTSLTRTSLLVISHDPSFLNTVCTDIIWYSTTRTLEYYQGNFDDFRQARQISSDEEAEAMLLGRDCDDLKGRAAGDEVAVVELGAREGGEASGGVTAGLLDKTSKISFPIPGTLKGHSVSKPVMELKNVYFAYNEAEGPMILNDVSCKVFLSSRIGIVGANGAGKSTLLNLLCGELVPSPGPGGSAPGEVAKHRNLRLAYIAQQHMFHLSDFLKSSPYVYIQQRYKNGFDEALQRRLIDPETPEEAKMRVDLAMKYGKYGKEVGDIVGRVVKGNDLFYEVQWKGMEDAKQNTFEPMSKLKMMGVASFAKAFDERQAASAAGIDTRPLSQKEIVKHFEQFGLDEEMVLNREIGGFSAGQKSKLTLGAAFWTKPHIVALDEPTNYIDMETLDALVKGLARYKGGIIVISHAREFVEQVCNETWLVEKNSIAKKEKLADK